MRNLFCLILLLSIKSFVSAQSYIGFGADNFNGVHGVLFNPANIADSRLKADVNLVSLSAFSTNTYYKINYLKWIFDDSVVDFEDTSVKVGADKVVNGMLHADVLGPSVMLTLNEKSSIAFTTRLRSSANINNLDGEIIDFFQTENLNDIEYFFAPNIDGSAIFNNWIEYGLSYARVLNTQSKVHFLKAGASLKLLSGRGFMSAQSDEVLVFYNAESDVDPDTVFFQGSASYGFSENFDLNENFIPFEGNDDSSFESQTLGLGLDLGFVYEYRPNFRQNVSRSHVQEQIIDRNISTYKYKIGLSLLDLGAMSYQNTRLVSSNLNDININQLFSDFEDDVKAGLGITESLTEERFVLPARLRLDIDSKLKEKIYLNMVTNFSLVSKNNKNASRFANSFSVSPRFESRWLTVFSPISYVQYGDVTWGVGTRLGPLVLGSSSLFSNLLEKESKAFDFYMGLKVPIFFKKPKVEEEDPTEGYKSNCNGCLDDKDDKIKKKRLEGFKGGRS